MLEMELEGQRWHGPHCACHMDILGHFHTGSRCHVFIGSPYPHCASSTEPHAPNIHNMTIQKSTSYIYILVLIYYSLYFVEGSYEFKSHERELFTSNTIKFQILSKLAGLHIYADH